jgi:hypothetical protein
MGGTLLTIAGGKIASMEVARTEAAASAQDEAAEEWVGSDDGDALPAPAARPAGAALRLLSRAGS